MKAFILASVLLASASVPGAAQEKKSPEEIKVTVNLENVAVKDVLESLTALTGVPIDSDEAASKKIDPALKVSFKVKDTSLVGALRLLLGPHGLEVTVLDKKKVLITVPKGH